MEVTSQVHAVGTSSSWVEAPSTYCIRGAQHLYLFCVHNVTDVSTTYTEELSVTVYWLALLSHVWKGRNT
jgi:hypothetical protein